MPAKLTRARMLALGDSYTIGEGVAADERWPAQLTRALRDAGGANLEVQIIATTGWTCADLAAALDAAVLTPPYTLVSLAIGVNDQYRGYPLDGYREAFARLLRRAITLAGDQPARVLVLSIPDWSRTRFAHENDRASDAEAAAIDACNAVAQAATLAAGAHWVDVTPASRAHARELAADGLHPSAAQYRHWLPPIRAAASAALSQPPAA